MIATTTSRKRKRQPISCKRCRERKEKCDRNRQGCENCKKHNVDCAWFDTDSVVSLPTPQATTSNSSTSVVISNPNTPSSSHPSVVSPADLPSYTPHLDTCCKLADQICRHLPTKKQTRLLLDRFREIPLVLWNCIDGEELKESLQKDWEALHAVPKAHAANRSRCSISFDTVTRLLLILASSIDLLPKSYLIAIGVVSNSDETKGLVITLINLYMESFQYCADQGEPGIAVLQSVFLFHATLTDKIPKNKQLSLLDSAMRIARQLGLDRLSSAYRDEQYWSSHGMQEGLQLATHTAQRRGNVTWAVSKLYAGDRSAREYGRAVWVGLVMMESVIPTPISWRPTSEMDTQPPGVIHDPYSQEKGKAGPFVFWRLVVDLTGILQDWTRMRTDCQAHGLGPDYRASMILQDRLNSTLDEWGGTAPLLDINLRRSEQESDTDFRERKNQSLRHAKCTFCILTKKTMLQRPFLGAAYRSNGSMEKLIHNSRQCALDIIQGARKMTDTFGPVPMKSSLARHSLLQAAMDLIIDLFFRPDCLDEQDGAAQVFNSLHYVINYLREDSRNYQPSSVLYDASSKLEVLLSLCARRYQAYLERGTITNNMFDQDAFREEADLDQLDEHLKQFGRVEWFFADTTSRLDESSIPQDYLAISRSEPQQSNSPSPLQQRTEWEGIWQTYSGNVQLDVVC